MSRIGKPTETERSLLVVRAGGEGRKVTADGYMAFFSGHEML